MDLRKLRGDLGWSMNKLAEEAGIAQRTVKAAEEGKQIQAASAKAIADALSQAYGREIRVSEIEGLHFV